MRVQPRFPRRTWAAFVVVSVISGCTVTQPAAKRANEVGFRHEAWRKFLPPSERPSEWSSTVPDRSAGVGRPRPGEFSGDHPRVDDFVEKYRTDLRGFFERAYSRSGRYVPRMQSILAREGLPTELAYLPLIESGYRLEAVSRAGAVGPWQFIRGTGKRYGLRMDGYVDERRDPVKSTRAAAHYLRDLYGMFGNWHLSLAAYNSGEDRVARILSRKGVDSYWDMRDGGLLPRETSDYVPRFLAAVQIAREPGMHGFDASEEAPLRYELVRVDRSLSFKTLARMAGVSEGQIAELNPALVRRMTPPDRRGYRIRLPKGTKARFVAAYADLSRQPEAVVMVSADVQKARRTYRVRRGDTPSIIAERFGVSVPALMRANRWKNARRLQPGQAVRLPVAES